MNGDNRTSMIQCGNCEVGFRRVGGIHIGSQRLGMIPDTSCQRVFAKRGEGEHARPWIACIDGEQLFKKDGEVRRFATESVAVNAARKASPKRWHP